MFSKIRDHGRSDHTYIAFFYACRPQHCSIKPLLAKFALLFWDRRYEVDSDLNAFLMQVSQRKLWRSKSSRLRIEKHGSFDPISGWAVLWEPSTDLTIFAHVFIICFHGLDARSYGFQGFISQCIRSFLLPVLPRIRFDIAICLYSLVIRNAYVCWGPAVIARQWLSATTFSLIIDHWEIKIGSNTLLSFHVWFQWGVDWSCCHWLYLSRFASHIHKFGNS